MQAPGHNGTEPGARFTAAQIAQACGGSILRGSPTTVASGVSTDTRTLMQGQAFFALVGPNHDAHSFLPQAPGLGAAVLVVEHLDDGWRPPQGVAVIRVPDTGRALLALAAKYRDDLRARVAAVTGSVGKSTVKNMLAQILTAEGRCTAAPASFNNRVGVPLTMLAAHPGDDFLVLEMGTNHAGEIDELARTARPDLGVITGIAETHLEGLGSLEGVREAKAELIPHLRPDGTLVLNADNPACTSLAGRFAGHTLTFGLSRDAACRARNARRCRRGWSFSLDGQRMRLSVPGRFNVLNATAAVCAAVVLGVPLEAAAAALPTCRPPRLRYEERELAGCRFVLDCYNSNPAAMRAALDSFISEPAAGRKMVVCGDMLELGPETARCHRELGRDLAGSKVDLLVAVGAHTQHVLDGWEARAHAPQESMRFASAEEAWLPLWRRLRPGDEVLVKGSNALHLATIADRIAEHVAAGREEAAA